jgi:predicted metalloprotease with PDZ domain
MFFASLAGLPAALAGLALTVSMTLAAGAAGAQEVHSDQVPTPQDTPYPGTIAIHVDASDTVQGTFRVHETIPVAAGAMTLLYPQWIPGDHAPTGPIAMLAGLRLSTNGKPLMWKRDKYNVYAFHFDVPAGVSSIDADFQYLSSRDDGFEITDRMMDMEWSTVALYPAGHFSRGLTFAPSVTFAHGWQFGTALETTSQSGDTVTFKPVTFENLDDSPIYAGQYFKRVDLNPGGDAPVHLDIVADASKYLEMTPEQLTAHRALVTQAVKLFGSHHYNHYDFLFSLSDVLGGNGTEHHQSSETPTTSLHGATTHPVATCWPMSTHIRGMASSVARPICGRPTSTYRWAIRCCGCTKARPSTGVLC